MKKNLNEIIFGDTDPRIYSALRIVFGILAFLLMLDFWPLLDQHFAANAWLSKNLATHSEISLGWSPLFFIHSQNALKLFYGCGMLSTIMFILGYKTRITSIITFVFLASFRDRNPILFDGDDEYVRMVIFLLCWAPSGKTWSLDSLKGKLPRIMASAWILRLIQIQLVSVYFCNGWDKLYGASWKNGSTIALISSNPVYGRFNLEAINHLPYGLIYGLKILSFITPFFQIALAISFCLPYFRRTAIWCGVLFHLGIEVFVKLRYFPWIMSGWYIAFINPSSFNYIEDKIKNYVINRIK